MTTRGSQGGRRRVVVYSPDRHICYDGRTPDRTGVGGGIVVRVRLSAALAALGHDVTHVCHTPQEAHVDGVHYVPLDAPHRPPAPDVFFAQSSGDRLDLTPAAQAAQGARLRLASVVGPVQLRGLADYDAHGYVVPSAFLARELVERWGLPAQRVHVVTNAVTPSTGGLRRGRRDRHRLVYASHPSKGLDAALTVLELLRREDDRFTLDVYGGARLWGGTHEPVEAEGVTDHGLVGQQQLAAALHRASYSLHLQEFVEGFGLTLSEAMAAGCIPVASPVGAFAERLHDGRNAAVVVGPPVAAAPRAAAAVLRLSRAPVRRRLMQVRARRSVPDWATAARRLTDVFDEHLRSDGHGAARDEVCT